MVNNGPIFINGFSRGGTTMLANLIASHPGVCYIGETHHAFKGHRHTDSTLRTVWKAVTRDFPATLRQREQVFSPRLIEPRREMNAAGLFRLRRVLDAERVSAQRHAVYSKYKSVGVPYSSAEISTARLLAKNVDGMVFTTDLLAAAYPNATFVGLHRDGFALCEGHLRRNRTAAESGARYRKIVDKMERDAASLSRYHFVRFEDLLADPLRTAERLFEELGMEIKDASQVRMQRRRVMDSSGNHQTLDGGDEWSVEWMDWDDLRRYCKPNVNKNQISRLSRDDREAFLNEAGETMLRLGYQPEPAVQAA